MAQATKTFRDDRLEIGHQKRAIKDALSLARTERDNLRRELGWETSRYQAVKSISGLRTMPQRLWLFIKVFVRQERLNDADQRVRGIEESLRATYRCEHDQFMSECRFLGAAV